MRSSGGAGREGKRESKRANEIGRGIWGWRRGEIEQKAPKRARGAHCVPGVPAEHDDTGGQDQLRGIQEILILLLFFFSPLFFGHQIRF